MGVEILGGLGKIGKVLRGISQKEGLYKYGPSVADLSPKEIAKAYGLRHSLIEPKFPPYTPLLMRGNVPARDLVGEVTARPMQGEMFTRQHFLEHPGGGKATLEEYSPSGFDADVLMPWNKFREDVAPVIAETRGNRPITNATTTDADGSGSRLYRALYDINRNVGGLNSVGYLTGVNREGRRLENMLSQYMLDPDATSRILIDPQQKILQPLNGQRGALVEPVGVRDFARKFQDDDALGTLAANSMLRSNQHMQGALNEIAPMDLISGPSPLDMVMRDRLMKSYAGPKSDTSDGSALGDATIRRALTFKGIDDALGRGYAPNEVIESIMDSNSPWYKGLFYKDGGSVVN